MCRKQQCFSTSNQGVLVVRSYIKYTWYIPGIDVNVLISQSGKTSGRISRLYRGTCRYLYEYTFTLVSSVLVQDLRLSSCTAENLLKACCVEHWKAAPVLFLILLWRYMFLVPPFLLCLELLSTVFYAQLF